MKLLARGNRSKSNMSDLVQKSNTENSILSVQEINNILDNIPSVFSRIDTVLENKPFRVIDETKLKKIESRIKEQNEKMYNFGRQDSQTTRKLMTLQMLNTADSTYRILRQILAQIERKQSAISESYVKLRKDYAEIVELQNKIKSESDPVEKIKLESDLQSKLTSLSNSFVYLEGALKEIGFLQDCYEQIKKNKNIPDDWDEVDFEKAEIEAHIRNAFRNGVRDFLCHGRLGMGTCEYFEQFGISPIEATFHISRYIGDCNHSMSKFEVHEDYSLLPDYDNFHDFLNRMVDLYKDAYKKACKRIGIDDDLISRDFILMSARNEEQYKLIEEKK